MLTTRERMEVHRKNPTCNSCHRFMDPIGLALDNFDVTAGGARASTAASSTPRRFLRRHADLDAVELVVGAAEAADAAGAHVHRKPDGLRAGPPRRVFDQPAIRAIAKKAEATTTECRRSSWASSRATPFRMKRRKRE